MFKEHSQCTQQLHQIPEVLKKPILGNSKLEQGLHCNDRIHLDPYKTSSACFALVHLGNLPWKENYSITSNGVE